MEIEFNLNLHLHIHPCNDMSYYEFIDKHERLIIHFKKLEEVNKNNSK